MTNVPPTRVVKCPNCGSETPVRNPGIVTLVCDNCKTLLMRQDDGFRPGETSLLTGALSGIGVGSKGKVAGQTVEVIGRVHCESAWGTWDEWYVEDKAGNQSWLIEDEGRFKWEQSFQHEFSAEVRNAPVGATTVVNEASYQILERGDAWAIGVEGQVPKPVYVGEKFTYVDLSSTDGTKVIGLEIDGVGELPANAEIAAFQGRILAREEVDLSAGLGPLPSEKGEGLKCKKCGASMEHKPLPQAVRTLSCAYCGSLHELEGGLAKLLSESVKYDAWALELGARGELFGKTQEVIGRTLYRDQERDDGRWLARTMSQEFLLLSEDQRFSTLQVGVDGIAWAEKQTEVPASVSYKNSRWGRAISHGSREFRMYEKGRSELAAVEGALPWRAQVGDKSQYADYLLLPGMWSQKEALRLSIEWSGEKEKQEKECSLARHVSRQQAQKTFQDIKLPDEMNKSPIRQNMFKGGFPRFGLVMVLAGILNIFGAWTMETDRQLLGNLSLPVNPDANLNTGLRTAITQEFTIEEGTRFVRVDYAANVNNTWVSLNVGLIDAKSGRLTGQTSQDMEYYHGVEDGESWSEGNQEGSQIYRAPKPGNYKMMIAIAEGSNPRWTSVVASISAVKLDTNQPESMGFKLMMFGFLLIVISLFSTRNPWDQDD